MFKKQRLCFCYLPIDKAVHVIGYWLGIELLFQLISYRNPVLVPATLTALAFWALMHHRKDTLKNRRNFFYVFTAWLCIGGTFAMLEAYKDAVNEEKL